MGTATANILDLLFDKEDGLIASTMDDDDPLSEHYLQNFSSDESSRSESSNDLLDLDIDPDFSQLLASIQDQKSTTSHIQNDHDYQKPQASPQTSDSGLSSTDSTDNYKRGTTSCSESTIGMDLEDIDISNIDVSYVNDELFKSSSEPHTSCGNMSIKDAPSSTQTPDNTNISYMLGNIDDIEESIQSQLSVQTVSLDAKSSSLPSDKNKFCMSSMRFSPEEKRLLAKEGCTIPEGMHLTKAEEKVLKRVRRKIRNKQSAMNSRAKKKEYVEGLETRVQLCTAQNAQLIGRVAQLENQNERLVQSLKKLQGAFKKQSTKSSQTSTCVLVLAMSFALIIVPQFHPQGGGASQGGVASQGGGASQGLDAEAAFQEVMADQARHIPVAGKSRSILSVREEAAPMPSQEGAGPVLTEEEAAWFGDNIPNILARMDTYQEKQVVGKLPGEPNLVPERPWKFEGAAGPPSPAESLHSAEIPNMNTTEELFVPIKEEL